MNKLELIQELKEKGQRLSTQKAKQNGSEMLQKPDGINTALGI